MGRLITFWPPRMPFWSSPPTWNITGRRGVRPGNSELYKTDFRADPEIQDKEGNTALHISASYGHTGFTQEMAALSENGMFIKNEVGAARGRRLLWSITWNNLLCRME